MGGLPIVCQNTKFVLASARPPDMPCGWMSVTLRPCMTHFGQHLGGVIKND